MIVYTEGIRDTGIRNRRNWYAEELGREYLVQTAGTQKQKTTLLRSDSQKDQKQNTAPRRSGGRCTNCRIGPT